MKKSTVKRVGPSFTRSNAAIKDSKSKNSSVVTVENDGTQTSKIDESNWKQILLNLAGKEGA